MIVRTVALGLFAATLSVAVLVPPAHAQESPSYVMNRISVSAVAQSASSTNYDTSLLLGQESPVGSASFCNLGFVSTFGFWSLRGHSEVPVQLFLDKLSADPLVVGLAWSGNDPEFEVYRSISADDVLQLSNLEAVTPMCSISDEAAQEPDLLFYSVIPRPLTEGTETGTEGGGR